MRNQIQTGYKIRVIKDRQGVEGLRPLWSRLQWYPDADVDLYLALWETNSSFVQPYIMSLEFEEEPKALLIARIEETPWEIRIGYKRLLKVPVRSLSIMYGGILGEFAWETESLVFNQISGCLKRREVDVVFFNHLRNESSFYNLVKSNSSFLGRDHSAVSQLHWKTIIKGSFDEFLLSRPKNFRNNIRKCTNRIHDKFGDGVTLDCFKSKETLNEAVARIESVASKTYHRGLGCGFINNDSTWRRMEIAAERGWLRVFILSLEGNAVSFLTGAKCGQTFFPWATGYDPAFNELSPGTYLFINAIRELCGEDTTEIDFGFGDAFYKHNICDESWLETSIYVFGPSWKGIMMSSMRLLNSSIHLLGERTLAKLGLLDRVKRAWKNRLEKGNDF